jgi:hypothetical protein
MTARAKQKVNREVSALLNSAKDTSSGKKNKEKMKGAITYGGYKANRYSRSRIAPAEINRILQKRPEGLCSLGL